MRQVPTILVVFAVAVVGQALTPSSFLSTVDRGRLKRVFNTAWELKDLPTVYYAVLGYKLLGETIPNAPDMCKYLTSSAKSKTSVDSLFYASSAAMYVPGCKLTPPSTAKKILTDVISDSSTTHELYYAVITLANFKLAIDSAAASKALQASLKMDDSVMNLGYAFHAAVHLDGDVSSFFDRIEDAVVQADEVDHKFLQFEGGVSVTANVISGAYQLAEKVNKSPSLTPDQAVKFANYFVNRKTVQFPRAASSLLVALSMFADNKFHIPLVTSLARNVALSAKEPALRVRITDVMGKPVTGLSVTADSAIRVADDAVVISKKPFTPDKNDNSVYSLNLLEGSPVPGFYKLSVSSVPAKPDSRLVGGQGAEINVKILTDIKLEGVELGVADADQSTAPVMSKLVYPNTHQNVLEADHHQRLLLRFSVKDELSKEAIKCHQTFIRLVNQETKQEITFVAEQSTKNMYKFDLEIHAKAKEFGSLSGQYSMQLLVGDAVVANPIFWKVATVILHFANQPETSEHIPSPTYKTRPEIQHTFQQPEKRPPTSVSNAFSVLVCLPVLILFILWGRIGVNISNFPVSLPAFGFHLCLGGIFALYGWFWLELNMFTTIKYLMGLAVVTFLCGHSLLSKVAVLRKDGVMFMTQCEPPQPTFKGKPKGNAKK